MGKGEEKPTPRHFKWLRRLVNRLRFRHSKFKDGKYTKRSKDIEKWRDDSDLTAADYPDYRWQVVTKGKAKRMVPSMVESTSEHQGSSSPDHDENHLHNHGQKCACQTLKELGMVHYEPKPQKPGSTRAPTVKTEAMSTTPTGCPHQKTTSCQNHGKESKTHSREHNSCPDNKCACRTLKELGMVWHEPKPKQSILTSRQPGVVGRGEQRTVTAELHKSPTVEEILTETMKEIRIGKESIHQRFQTTPMYKTLGDDEVPDEYPHMQKVVESRKKQPTQGNLTAGPRYVQLPSSSLENQNGIQLDLIEVTIPSESYTTRKVDSSSLDPFLSHHADDHNIQAESENDKNHLKAVKGFNNDKNKKEKLKNNTKKASNSPRKPKTPKHRRSLRQRAERKLRKYTVPKGYHKLKEHDVDEDIIKVEQDLNVRKERRKHLKKQNTPEWMIAEETLVLRQMSNATVQQSQDNQQQHQNNQPLQQKRNRSGGSQKSAPMPRGSPSARKGSPRHVLHQMQAQQAGK